VLKAILSTLAWMAALFAGVVLAAWAIGHAVTDRWVWSQYLYWMPTPAALIVSMLSLMAGTGCALLARHVAAPRPKRGPAFWLRAVLAGAWVLTLGYMLLVEWRWGASSPKVAAGSSFRLLFWNSEVERLDKFEERILSQKPDVAIIANAPHRPDWQAISNDLGGKMYSTRSIRFTVISRYPLLRWGSTDLKIKGSRPRVAVWTGGGNIALDTGEAIFVELDTTAVTGRTTVIWGLDLPSDPGLIRMDLMQQAMGTLESFSGPAFIRTGNGMDQREDAAGFPKPDVIVGDFNTPRGSESLNVVAGDMHHAFNDAGRGYAATWPRKFPIIAIDQAFLGPHLTATGYHIVDLGASQHCTEVIDIAGAKAP
jgi:hypothetical protein